MFNLYGGASLAVTAHKPPRAPRGTHPPRVPGNPRGPNQNPHLRYNVFAHDPQFPTPAFYSLLRDPSSVFSPTIAIAPPGLNPGNTTYASDIIRCISIFREVFRMLRIRNDARGANYANKMFSVSPGGMGILTADILAMAMEYVTNNFPATPNVTALMRAINVLISQGKKYNGITRLTPLSFYNYYWWATNNVFQINGGVSRAPTAAEYQAFIQELHHLVVPDTDSYGPFASAVVGEPTDTAPPHPGYNYFMGVPPGNLALVG